MHKVGSRPNKAPYAIPSNALAAHSFFTSSTWSKTACARRKPAATAMTQIERGRWRRDFVASAARPMRIRPEKFVSEIAETCAAW